MLRDRPIFRPICWESWYRRFDFIDPVINFTIDAAMIERAVQGKTAKSCSTLADGLTVWFTGLSSAGKTTLSRAVYERLRARGHRAELLDGDEVRRNLSRGLGFSKEDRNENVRRIGFVAEILTRNGVIALVSAISPYREARDELRGRSSNFLEVYVNAPIEICEGRDVKGLYRKARSGELQRFTGIDDPYEPPLSPDVECRTDRETIVESAEKIVDAVEARLSLRVTEGAVRCPFCSSFHRLNAEYSMTSDRVHTSPASGMDMPAQRQKNLKAGEQLD